MQIDRSEEQKLFSKSDKFNLTIRIVESSGEELDVECEFYPGGDDLIIKKVVYIGEYWYPELNEKETFEFIALHWDDIVNKCWQEVL